MSEVSNIDPKSSAPPDVQEELKNWLDDYERSLYTGMLLDYADQGETVAPYDTMGQDEIDTLAAAAAGDTYDQALLDQAFTDYPSADDKVGYVIVPQGQTVSPSGLTVMSQSKSYVDSIKQDGEEVQKIEVPSGSRAIDFMLIRDLRSEHQVLLAEL